MNTYLEIVETKKDKVVLRIDVTDKGEGAIDKIENGMNINLNHSEYHTRTTESKENLPIIKIK